MNVPQVYVYEHGTLLTLPPNFNENAEYQQIYISHFNLQKKCCYDPFG